jgi:anti-sigma-K factor RskA/putative zinc finger protein
MTEAGPTAPLSCDEVRDLAAGFVLDILEEEETARLRHHLWTCPDPHPEIDELGGITPYLADSLEPVEPPADLGRRIVAAVAAEAAAVGAEREAAATPSIPTPALPPAGRAPASPSAGQAVPVSSLAAERARRRSPQTWIAAIAAVLVVAALGAWNLSLRTELESARTYDAAVNRVIELATAPGGEAAILRPQVAGGPAGIAAVGPDGRVEIALRGLAPTSGTEVYEAWLIGPENTPVAIGSLTPAADGLGVLHATGAPTGRGVTIALTREPTAGRTSPTPPILSVGVASGST